MSVIDEIAAERVRQIEVEGWTPEHDDEHGSGQLAQAAACYAAPRELVQREVRKVPRYWPWSREWWKPRDRRHDLIRAAALLVAEVERLDRAKSRRGDDLFRARFGAPSTPPAAVSEEGR